MSAFVSGVAAHGHNAKAFMQQFWIEKEKWQQNDKECMFQDPVFRACQYARMIGLLSKGTRDQRHSAQELNREAGEHVWSSTVEPVKCRRYQKIAETYLGVMGEPEDEDSLDRCSLIALAYYDTRSKTNVIMKI
jgi:hypothetical protein